MAPSTVTHVFISYSRRDEVFMQRVVACLRQKGINVWVDNEKLVPGTPIWEREIEKAIDTAFAVVVVLSPDAKESIWVLNELTLADEYKKRVFPVLVRGDKRDAIPFRLITRQFVDLQTNEEKGLESLSAALAIYIDELKEYEEEHQAAEWKEEQQEQIDVERLATQKAEEERLVQAKLEEDWLDKKKTEVEQFEERKMEQSAVTTNSKNWEKFRKPTDISSTHRASASPSRSSNSIIKSLIFILGICIIIGLISTNYISAQNANATSTARSATSIVESNAVATEYASYYYDDFADEAYADDGFSWIWGTGDIENDYWVGSVLIESGVLKFIFSEIKKPTGWLKRSERAYFDTAEKFHLAVDGKSIGENPTSLPQCYGLFFNGSKYLSSNSMYRFAICDDYYYISLVVEDYPNESQVLIEPTYNSVIVQNEWNRMQVYAQNSQFDFYINDVQVDQINDSTLSNGKFGLFFTIDESTDQKQIWFDNFLYEAQ